MLYTILKHIRNFFPDLTNQKEAKFEIVNGILASFDFVKNGQYYLIEGSVFNDGVYQKGKENLTDEEFNGIITPLRIPAEFLALVAEIEDFVEKNPTNNLQSESFGGYSYTKASAPSGNPSSWANAFATRLNAWRKI